LLQASREWKVMSERERVLHELMLIKSPPKQASILGPEQEKQIRLEAELEWLGFPKPEKPKMYVLDLREWKE
jgi:hypothetical protein